MQRRGSIERDTSNTDVDVVAPSPCIIDWDGPDDPENPLNWPTWRKSVSVIHLSFVTFLTYVVMSPLLPMTGETLTPTSPLASSMIAPNIADIMTSFDIQNTYIGPFIVTGYLLGYCTGPLVIAPLSELYGRQILYNLCNLIYLIFSIACAVAPDPGSLIVFRIFAGVGGSCPITLGPGSIADMIKPEQRGAAMALWVIGPLLGPTVGPIGRFSRHSLAY